MKYAILLLTMLFGIQNSFCQDTTLEIDDCSSLIVISSSDSKYNKTYILEKENDQGVWKSLSRISSKESDLNFLINEDGNYKVTIQSPVEGRTQTNATYVDCKVVQPRGDVVSLYPNPTQDILHLSLDYDPDSAYSYQIMSIVGKKVLGGSIEKSNTTLSLSDIPGGVYVVKLMQNKTVIQTSQLIINQ